MRLKQIIVLLLLSFISFGQSPSKVMPLESFMFIVNEHHPMIQQMKLMDDNVRANRLYARGFFDPKLEGSYDEKSFDDKNYYREIHSSLKIPTWYGIQGKVAYDNNQGVFLNNRDELPDLGLWSIGVELSLARGIMFDERRAQLEQAKLFEQENQFNQQILLNDLYFQSSFAYLEWQVAYAQLQLQQEGLDLALLRKSNIVQSFLQGDKPAIDSLEADIIVQNRQQLLSKAEQNLNKARLELNNYLWSKGFVPLELSNDMIPEQLNASSDDIIVISDSELEEIILRHPDIQLYNLKLDRIDIDRRLIVEDLKPDIKLSYNPITAYDQNNVFAPLEADQYKLGATVSYSLFQRKARGKLQQTKIKAETTDLQLNMKKQSLRTKLSQLQTNSIFTQEQLFTAVDLVEQYERLLNAERRKFDIGESSIFLINSREVKYLESQLKLIGLEQLTRYYQLSFDYESMQFTL